MYSLFRMPYAGQLAASATVIHKDASNISIVVPLVFCFNRYTVTLDFCFTLDYACMWFVHVEPLSNTDLFK